MEQDTQKFKEVEAKWQEFWEKHPELYRAEEDIATSSGSSGTPRNYTVSTMENKATTRIAPTKEKKYVLVEFPYPSGSGLHVGHAFSFTGADVYARFKRMQGFNVLFPMGWDAFGLPTENYAIKTKQKPQKVTKDNTDKFRSQMKQLAFSFDWQREVNTTDPDYYKWTQWIFIELFKAGLAYKKEMPINWCPSCKIGLANEEVISKKSKDESGKIIDINVCERCGAEVVRRNISQWVVKITDYADKLASGLEKTAFIDKVKQAQINWIGKSEGAKVRFQIKKNEIASSSGSSGTPRNDGSDEQYLEVFTTRPDTLFGATFMVVAPEHPLVSNILTRDGIFSYSRPSDDSVRKNSSLRRQQSEFENLEQSRANHDSPLQEIQDYVNNARKKSDLERSELNKEKTGVFSGLYAINPATGKEIPIWISDFVLSSYGTGAIMSVPAHDQRDFDFAKKFGLDVRFVVKPEKAVYTIVEKSLTPENYQRIFNFGDVKVREKIVDWGDIVELTINSNKEKELLEFLKNNLLTESPDGGSWYADSMGTTNVIVFNNKIVDANTYEGLEEFKRHGLSVGIPTEQLDVEFECNPNADEGVMINSDFLNGLRPKEAIEKMANWLSDKGIGEKTATYHLRDWIFSRQHYWGEPIPMIYCEEHGWQPVPEEQLPVRLPDVEEYEPTDTGESPLSTISGWVDTVCPICGKPAKRETDTMPNWAGSDWYFLRYIDPVNEKTFADFDKMKYWLPVDVYIGGDEHNTLHLLYSRFIYRFLYDKGYVPTEEPYFKRLSHGVILGPDGQRMSKSKGNVVVPEVVAEKYGVDVVRMYLMFMGPFDGTMAWNEKTLMGVKRFLDRYSKFLEEQINYQKIAKIDSSQNVKVIVNKLIKGVSEDIDNFRFNTAIAKTMEASNALLAAGEKVGMSEIGTLLKLIAPLAPYLAEEMWDNYSRVLDTQGPISVHISEWPIADVALLVEEKIRLAVAVNGKVRDEIEIKTEAKDDRESVLKAAKESSKVKSWLGDKQIIKEIYIPGKMVNFVIS